MAKISKYTSLKLLLSYLSLLGLMTFAVWYLLQQQSKLNQLLKSDSSDKNQLVYTELIRDLYETDNQSKIALQTKSKQNISLFVKANNTISQKLDSLKTDALLEDSGIIDTLKQFLNYKKQNVLELVKLQDNVNVSFSIQQVVSKIENIEEIKGKLKLENLFLNVDDFNPYQKKVAQDYVDYLNENVPKDSSNTISAKEADSILTASKIILLESQKKNNQQSIAIKNKEVELLKNELFITQKLSDIVLKLRQAINAEQEKVRASKIKNQEDSLRLLSFAAIACLLLVVFFFILLSTDFLKNKNYRQDLEVEKQKTEILLESREQLMAAVSHDIRTPLQSVIGYSAQLLAKEDSFQNRAMLIKIKSATHYIEQLVSDLLDYVRMEKGKIKVFSQEFDLNELLEETAQNIADLHQEKEVELRYAIQQTEDLVYYGDYNKIRQILYNLIGNAFKFTSKGSVTIETKIQEKKVFILIKDTGVGIASESFEKIFDSFTQAHSDIELLYGGTGLGLSICRKLIHLLEGEIKLESKVEEGSIFTVDLPLRNRTEKTAKGKVKLDTCLLLDDDASQIALTKSILKPYFKAIFTFTDGNEAIAFCKLTLPSIVFSDIQMPNMDGYTFIEALRKIPKATTIPVVFISGQVPEEKESRLYTDFLLKPSTPNQILSMLSKFSDINLENSANKVTPTYTDILQSFLGENPKEIEAFIINYTLELSKDIANLKIATSNKKYKNLTSISHKMQTMIGQFEEKELLVQLQTLELEAKKGKVVTNFESLFVKLEAFKEKLTTNYTA